MTNNLPVVVTGDIPLGLDKEFFDQYKTFDEKQTLYAEIKQTAAAASWMQADFFKFLWEETNEKTLNKFAGTVGEPPGTISNYIRTARAFEPIQRNPMLTFSHHFQASLADNYDTKTKTFQSKKRYKWIDKAIDLRWTTRALNEAIMRTKKIKQLGTGPSCYWCHKINADVIPFNFYNTSTQHTDHVDFHLGCYKELVDYVKAR
jgi:hypothetical protein